MFDEKPKTPEQTGKIYDASKKREIKPGSLVRLSDEGRKKLILPGWNKSRYPNLRSEVLGIHTDPDGKIKIMIHHLDREIGVLAALPEWLIVES